MVREASRPVREGKCCNVFVCSNIRRGGGAEKAPPKSPVRKGRRAVPFATGGRDCKLLAMSALRQISAAVRDSTRFGECCLPVIIRMTLLASCLSQQRGALVPLPEEEPCLLTRLSAAIALRFQSSPKNFSTCASPLSSAARWTWGRRVRGGRRNFSKRAMAPCAGAGLFASQLAGGLAGAAVEFAAAWGTF